MNRLEGWDVEPMDSGVHVGMILYEPSGVYWELLRSKNDLQEMMCRLCDALYLHQLEQE